MSWVSDSSASALASSVSTSLSVARCCSCGRESRSAIGVSASARSLLARSSSVIVRLTCPTGAGALAASAYVVTVPVVGLPFGCECDDFLLGKLRRSDLADCRAYMFLAGRRIVRESCCFQFSRRTEGELNFSF